MNSVHVHIDRIVIHGMSRMDGKRLATALEQKLRDWAEKGQLGNVPGDALTRIASLNAGRLRPCATPVQAAAQIVQAIQTRLSEPAPAPKPGNRSRHV